MPAGVDGLFPLRCASHPVGGMPVWRKTAGILKHLTTSALLADRAATGVVSVVDAVCSPSHRRVEPRNRMLKSSY
jgi:hypothetical protein